MFNSLKNKIKQMFFKKPSKPQGEIMQKVDLAMTKEGSSNHSRTPLTDSIEG